jgi:hypothetical protein
MRGLIFEVAATNCYGNIQNVERVKLYDFFNYLAFKRTQDKELEKYYESKSRSGGRIGKR